MTIDNYILNSFKFRYLHLKSNSVAGVFHVDFPKLPWNYKHGSEERNILITSLCKKFKFNAIWLSDWVSDNTKIELYSRVGRARLYRARQFSRHGLIVGRKKLRPTYMAAGAGGAAGAAAQGAQSKCCNK